MCVHNEAQTLKVYWQVSIKEAQKKNCLQIDLLSFTSICSAQGLCGVYVCMDPAGEFKVLFVGVQMAAPQKYNNVEYDI